jgi:phospholipase/carboxylesterase
MTSDTGITLSVIWLHGIGQSPEHVQAVAHWLALPEAGVRGVFPRAPAAVVSALTGRAASAWFVQSLNTLQADQRSLVAAERRLRPLIDAEVERFGAQRVALAGFSQGGVMALYSGLRYRLPLAGIAVYAAFPLNNVDFFDSLSLSTSKVPIWMGHGVNDWVIPCSNGWELKQMLIDRGHPVTWHWYRGGHEVFGGVRSELAEFFEGCASSQTPPSASR